MIYLDSSALMKLVRREDETDALCNWLEARPEQSLIAYDQRLVEAAKAVGLRVHVPGQP